MLYLFCCPTTNIAPVLSDDDDECDDPWQNVVVVRKCVFFFCCSYLRAGECVLRSMMLSGWLFPTTLRRISQKMQIACFFVREMRKKGKWY